MVKYRGGSASDAVGGGFCPRRYSQKVDFMGTLVASLVGALAGAVVGAFAAWLFALNLRNREATQAKRDRLDSAVADVIRLLGTYGGAYEAFLLASTLRNPSVTAPPPHLVIDELLSATRVAIMAAVGEDGPLWAVIALLTTSKGDGRNYEQRVVQYHEAAHILLLWRTGEKNARDAEAAIKALPTVSVWSAGTEHEATPGL